jgi:hypothetical protein
MRRNGAFRRRVCRRGMLPRPLALALVQSPLPPSRGGAARAEAGLAGGRVSVAR